MERKILLLSALVAAGLGLFASRILIHRNSAAPAHVAAATEQENDPSEPRGLRVRTKRRLGLELQLRTLLGHGKWEEAMALAEELRTFDPINAPAREGLRRGEAELLARSLFAKAWEEREGGREKEALEAFLRIPAGTESHQRARIEVQRLALRMGKRARGDCLGLEKAARYQEALASCRLSLDLACIQREEPEILRRVRQLEKRLGVREPWACTGRLRGWIETTEEVTLAEAIGEDPRLRETLRQWASGEVGDRGIAAVGRLAREGIQGAAQMQEPMQAAENHLRQGLAALLEGRLPDAEERLRAAASAEGAILGAARSTRLEEAYKDLGRRWHGQGLGLEERHRWREAFDAFRRGQEADPQNVEILRALWRLERRAEEMAAAGGGCNTLDEARSITVPGSVARRKVEAASTGCPSQ